MNLRFRSIAGLAVVCLLSVTSSGSEAQLSDGNSPPPALKDLRRATGQCRPQDVGGKARQTSTAPATMDLKCAIGAADVREILAGAETSLVDLRPNADFQGFHIANAINLSLADLHGKPYWRDKNVILIGDGKAEVELYRECVRLKAMGYRRVRVLQGGMAGWLSQDQPVVGRAPTAAHLARLSPTELWAESRNGLSAVLLDPTQTAMQGDLPASQVLPRSDPAAVKAFVARGARQKRAAPLAAIIVVAPPTLTDDQIRQLQQAVTPLPLLVYADTRDAYVRAIAKQKAIWDAEARGPKQPGCGL